MPLAFIAIGVIFLISAVRGTVLDYNSGGTTQQGLLTLLKNDFVGDQNTGGLQNTFLVWLVALYIIGALGYIPGFRPVANALLFLVILVMVLVNNRVGANTGGGFFANLNAAIRG